MTTTAAAMQVEVSVDKKPGQQAPVNRSRSLLIVGGGVAILAVLFIVSAAAPAP